SLAFVHASASAVWPPTGIAFAATLLLGYRVWPAILLGAFLVNATTEGSVWTSLGIASGNTLEGLLGAWLVTRFANGRNVFSRSRSEEHTSELQSRFDLVCRLLLEKKKKKKDRRACELLISKHMVGNLHTTVDDM